MGADPVGSTNHTHATPERGVQYTTQLHIRPPTPFNFWRTVYSHGWCSLPPFSVENDTKTLRRVLSLPNGVHTHCTLGERRDSVVALIRSSSPISQPQRQEIITQVRTCLRLDEDFSLFFREARKHPRYRWIARSGAGRLLRSPTVFEDIIKMICTTNCTWALTTTVVDNLVEHLGQVSGGLGRTFPSPEAIARSNERFLRTTIKAGYRAPYLLELARAIASGRMEIESWRTSQLDASDLYRQILSVKGVGPYAAQNLMKLLGRYDYLALDSWVRAKYAELHHRGRRVKDSTIERHYASFGQWRGLFFWLDMTRQWHDGKFPP